MATKQRHLNKAEKAKAKAAFVEAFKKAGGIMKDACEKTGIPRRTIFDWRQQDPEFDAAAATSRRSASTWSTRAAPAAMTRTRT